MSRIHAPEFPQSLTWLNTDRPLSLECLRGQVVILDFWTYCCINCLHVLPDLKYLERKYEGNLTVIGVHSAKFDQERGLENIRQAILRYDLEHPVLVDEDFQVWEQYTVKAWPTLVVIDPQGYYLGSISGEGHLEVLDELVEKLIAEHREAETLQRRDWGVVLEKDKGGVRSPLAFPGKVLADAKSNCLYVADSGHHRLVVASLTGEVLEVIGSGKPGWLDGGFEQAQFYSPQGMTFDAASEVLYVADMGNHLLRKVDFRTRQVETVAGTGEQSREIISHGGLGLTTALNSPWDVLKVGERLLIAMAGSHQIWEMQLETGWVETYAGNGRESCVNGSLAASALAQPSGISTDGYELFVADSESSSIRAVGIVNYPRVRTVCGSGDLFGFGDQDGHGESVLLQHCLGVEYTQNYLWVADTYNHKIKRVAHRTGLCQTFFGDGVPGYRDGKASESRFWEPSGLSALGPHLFVADTNNHKIRLIDLNKFMVTTLEFPGLCAPDVCVPDVGAVKS